MAGGGRLAYALLQQGEALPEAAEGGGGGGLQEKQVLVQGSEGAGARQRLNRMHEVLLLTFHLVHHLENKDNKDEEGRSFPEAPRLPGALEQDG